MSAGADPARRRATWLFLAAVALNGLAYLLLLAPWMGEDEPWQLEYATYVADGHMPWGGTPIPPPAPGVPDPRTLMSTSQLQALREFGGITPAEIQARQLEILDSMRAHGWYRRVDWAGVEEQRTTFDMVVPNSSATKEKPLYYLIAGHWMRLCGAHDVEARLWAARTLSWMLYVATAAAALAFARTLFDDERVALCTAALVAFLPMSARQAALVNNDVLARFFAALALWLAARWLRRRASPWGLGAAVVVCALGLATKTTAVSALAAVGLAVLLRSERIGTRLVPLASALAGLAVVGWVVLRLVFANSPAMPHTLLGFLDDLDTGFSRSNLAKFARTFAGSFAWESRFLPGAVNLALGIALAAACARLALAWRRVAHGPALAWCALTLLVQLGMILLHGVAVGRYLMPMLPVLATLVAGGLVLAARDRERAAGRFVLVLAVYDAYVLFGGLAVHEYLLLGA